MKLCHVGDFACCPSMWEVRPIHVGKLISTFCYITSLVIGERQKPKETHAPLAGLGSAWREFHQSSRRFWILSANPWADTFRHPWNITLIATLTAATAGPVLSTQFVPSAARKRSISHCGPHTIKRHQTEVPCSVSNLLVALGSGIKPLYFCRMSLESVCWIASALQIIKLDTMELERVWAGLGGGRWVLEWGRVVLARKV